MSFVEWLIALIVFLAGSLCGGGSPASDPEPVSPTSTTVAEIGSALSCEVVSETEIECREVFEDGTVITWREDR